MSVSNNSARSSFSLASIGSTLDAIDEAVFSPVESVKRMMSTQTERESVNPSTGRSSIYSLADRPSVNTRSSSRDSVRELPSVLGSSESARGSLARSVTLSESYRRTPHPPAKNSYHQSIGVSLTINNGARSSIARANGKNENSSGVINTVVSFVSIVILVLLVCAAFIFSNELLEVADKVYKMVV